MNKAKIKALALEIELDLLQLDKKSGAEVKPNKEVKASVIEAIKQLTTHSLLLKGQSNFAIQVLYNSFKDVEPIIYDQEDEPERIIDVYDEKSLQYAMLTSLTKKSNFVHSYYGDDRFTLTQDGERVIEAINARLETLKAKKRGTDLFPELMGAKRK